MRSHTLVAIVMAAMLALISCSRDPEVAKKRYLESGNRYFDKGKFREARIMYKDALQKDQRFGTAWYRLGLTAIRLGSYNEAVSALRRAIELVKPEQPDHWDAVVKLSEIYLALGRDQKSLMDEVEGFCKQLVARDPNSFDAHRLTGDLNFARSIAAYKTSDREEGAARLADAIAEYQRANQLKPGQQGVMMQLARAYSGKGDFVQAEQLYRQVLNKDKTFQPAYTELYRIFAFQRKPEEGEKILKQAYQANPKQYNYLSLLAQHYAVLGRRDDMVKVLQEIESHSKDYDQAYLLVGDFYLRLNDGESALKEYRQGMAKDAKRKSTYQKRMIEVLMRQGKRAEAAEINSAILKADPNDNDAKGLAATFLLDKGDIAQALSDLQAVVTRAPDNAVARFNLGRAHAARGEWEQARQAFQKAIELRPDYLMARLALAQLQVARGEFDAALKTAEQVLAIDHGNVNARLIESAALMGQKKFSESRAMLDSMAKAYPNASEVYFQLGVVSLAENKFKDAREAFQKSYQLNPANSRGLMGVVETDMAENKPDAALAALQAEADRSPTRVELRMALGSTAVRTGRYDIAVEQYQKALNSVEKGTKQRGEVLVRLAEVYRRKGDDANAVLCAQQAREIMPDNLAVLSTLGLTLDHANRWNEARQVYEAALKLDANYAVVLNNLAFLLAEHNGDLDDALTKATKAKQLMPNLAEISDTLGWIYLKKNLSDNAIDIFKDLVAKAPNQSTFRYHLAMALNQKGDKTRAIKELQEALKSNPPKAEKEKIQQMLTRLNG
jgi:tetratricopeptide (TPR) repeat protein